jgi:hypothetical protein
MVMSHEYIWDIPKKLHLFSFMFLSTLISPPLSRILYLYVKDKNRKYIH